MSKKKSQRKNRESKEQTVVVMSRGDLQSIITKAIIEAKAADHNAPLKQPDREKINWKSLLLLCLFPRKYAKESDITITLLQTAMRFIFGFAALAMLAFAIILWIVIPINIGITMSKGIGRVIAILTSMIIGIPYIFFAGLLNVVRVEVSRVHDSAYLFGLFASMSSIISTIIAILSLSQ